MADTTTREFMIAHFVLHGWCPVDITGTMLVQFVTNRVLSAHYVARKWYCAGIIDGPWSQIFTTAVSWEHICDAAMEAMFKELTRDEPTE